jgi:hypothetical protein
MVDSVSIYPDLWIYGIAVNPIIDTATLGTAAARLHRWARHRTVGAKNAAVAGLGLETLAAALAIVEELAGVSGHRFDSRMVAMGADYRGFQKHRRCTERAPRDRGPAYAGALLMSQSTGGEPVILIILEIPLTTAATCPMLSS